tara:strand:- start:214 stop:408 length:195 start_codon:yes stop_codon:yes gene_type:complete
MEAQVNTYSREFKIEYLKFLKSTLKTVTPNNFDVLIEYFNHGSKHGFNKNADLINILERNIGNE